MCSVFAVWPSKTEFYDMYRWPYDYEGKKQFIILCQLRIEIAPHIIIHCIARYLLNSRGF